jgi:hypothetical protein
METHPVDAPRVTSHCEQENLSVQEYDSVHPNIAQIVILCQRGLTGEGVTTSWVGRWIQPLQ